MELNQLLIWQLLAHILADFIFQGEDKAMHKNKWGFKSKHLKWHIMVVFLLSWLFSFQLNYIFASLFIAITHWLLDGIKPKLYKVKKIRPYLFFIDQILHLSILSATIIIFSIFFEIDSALPISIKTKYLLIVMGYIICTKPANILIKEIFNTYEIKMDNKGDDLRNAGKLIGITERLLVFTFILLNQFEAVGFLIAAKSILRFKDNSTIKTEYVLIGTMLSFGIAIAIGVLINVYDGMVL
jgi:hypothetical protein